MSTQAVADPYWSRTEKWEIVDREDPVLWGADAGGECPAADQGAHALKPADLESYRRMGFHHAPRLFAQHEADEMRTEAKRLAAEAADQPGPGVVIEPGSDVVRSVFRVHRTSDLFQSVVHDPRLIDVARQVLGGDVYVHQSRINFKPGFDGKEFFWHSDFETWHIEDGMPRMRAVSVSISLTDNYEFNGPLMLVAGSHQYFVRCIGATPENHYEKSLRKQEYGVPSRQAMQQLVEQGEIVAPKGPPGMALFFECNLMHGSGGNLSPYSRTNLFVVFNSVENPAVEPFGDRRPRPEYLAEREFEPVRL